MKLRYLGLGGLALVAWAGIAWYSSDRTKFTPVDNFNPTDTSQKKNGAADAAKPTEKPRSELTSIELIEEQQRFDLNLWAKELLAEEYERRFIKLGDELRTAPDGWAVLGALPFRELRFARPGKPTAVGLGVNRTICDQEPTSMPPNDVRREMAHLAEQGWKLMHCEWRHADFKPADGAEPAKSKIEFSLHLANKTALRRAIVRGTLAIVWAMARDANGYNVPETIDAVGAELLTRGGETPFTEIQTAKPREGWAGSDLVEPIVLADTDRDGASDVLLLGRNLKLHNLGNGKFEQQSIADRLPRLNNVAIHADLDGDGNNDLAGFYDAHNLLIISGDAHGEFTSPPDVIWNGDCPSPHVITAGDVDGDGDLDLFVGQHLPPYTMGQMPTPFYDSNDGLPYYLLLNDGHGKFTDGTVAAGLDAKRRRRVHAATLVDFDRDGDLDLVIASDFCGVEVYQNDGHGKFEDTTDAAIDERHSFAQSQAFADFDGDGTLDLFVAGVESAAGRRLDAMKLTREDRPEAAAMRPKMNHGNRLYLHKDARFEQPAWSDDVARTGWPFGATAFDIDNDGDRDLYVANGHMSGNSVRDYASSFWMHDIYIDRGLAAEAAGKLFDVNLGALNRRDVSWNGFEHNKLLINQSANRTGQPGGGFVSIGFLTGTAFEFDARAVASDDFDGDGRADLLVVENRSPRSGVIQQTLHILGNRLPASDDRHWIGVRLDSRRGNSLGATIVVHSALGDQPASIVAGDSWRCQSAAMAHFGLGKTKSVTSIEVRWPNGKVTKLDRPRIDTYHAIAAPE